MLLKTKYEIPQVDEYEVANNYLTSIYNQVHQLKYNYTGMVVGRPQAGKSMNTGTIGCLLDKTFWDNLENRVVYDARSFMGALTKIIKNKQIGRFIKWDEAGVGMPARQWYDISNRAISFAIQVAGVFRPIIFFVTQDVTYIDSQPRKLINSFWEVTRSTTKYSEMRVYNIQINRKKGTMYFKNPNMMSSDGLHLKLAEPIKVMKPPKEFIKRYLAHSRPYKEKITDIMEQRTEDFSAGLVQKKEYSVAEIIQSVLDNMGTYESTMSEIGKRRFSRDLIAHDFQIPANLSSVIKLRSEQLANKKEETEGLEL